MPLWLFVEDGGDLPFSRRWRRSGQKLLSGGSSVGEGGPCTHRQILKLKKVQTREDNGLYSGEARDRREEAEEGGEEGRDGAVQEAQACPTQHQQQGKDLQAGNYNQSQNW